MVSTQNFITASLRESQSDRIPCLELTGGKTVPNLENSAFYEKKIIADKDFPINIILNSISSKMEYFHPHWHEQIEMHYILQGSSLFHCNEKKIAAGKGSLVIFNGNEMHAGKSETDFMLALVTIFNLNDFSVEFSDKRIVFQNFIESDPFLQDKLELIYHEYQLKSLGYKLAIKGLMSEAVAYMARNYALRLMSEKESRRREKQMDLLNTAISYIKVHYSENISLKQLADAACLSESRFSHLFTETFSASPMNYLNEVRVKKARNLLRSGEYRVSEAALLSGFSDLNNFRRQYRKVYSEVPSSTLK